MADLLLAAALLAAATQPSPGQLAPTAQTAAESLGWLEGRWRGAGATMGRADEAMLEIRPALGGAFTELSYRAGRFEGRAFYRRGADGRWTASWFDNRGVSFAIVATVAGQTLTAEWGSPGAERGRTHYRLGADGRLHVTDSVLGPDGSYRTFATHVLTRIE